MADDGLRTWRERGGRETKKEEIIIRKRLKCYFKIRKREKKEKRESKRERNFELEFKKKKK